MSFRKSTRVKKQIPVCQHLGLFVNNLGKVSRFYIEKIGFILEKEFWVDRDMMKKIFGINSSCKIQYLSLNGLGMELFCFEDIKLKKYHAQTSGLNHWTLLVEDKYLFCEKLKKDKVTVIPIKKPHGTTFFIKDPEKNLIEVKSYRA